MVSNTDLKKFDDMLRQALSRTPVQGRQLTAYLEDRFLHRECVYGLHVSDSALITCLIGNRSGEHYHFIEGADGGYALAAAAMKQGINKLSLPATTQH